MKRLYRLLLAGFVANAPAAYAHGIEEHGRKSSSVRKEQKAWGIAGEAGAAKRTVEVRMTDNMRFGPDNVEVRQGDTVRFVVHNAGRAMHEFVIGTRTEQLRLGRPAGALHLRMKG